MNTEPDVRVLNLEGREAIRAMMANELGIPLEELQPDARWAEDLDIDRHTVHELLGSLEARLDIELGAVSPLPATVGELVAAVAILLGAGVVANQREAYRLAS